MQTRVNTIEKKRSESVVGNYYARILFFAFLTRGRAISLADLIASFSLADNQRIARNLGISKKVLESINRNINKFVLRDLDYKIQNINRLSNDASVNAKERAAVAIRKFGKLGDSVVVTPKNICDDMVALIPDSGFINAVTSGHKVLDIAGKAGEFALAIYERYERLGYGIERIKDTVYTIPATSLTYEFTRYMYETLGFNVANIAERFDDYDLLKVREASARKGKSGKIDYQKICALLRQVKPFNTITIEDEIEEGGMKVNFDVVVGNPPYQVSDGGHGASALPICQEFVRVSTTFDPVLASLIIPSRWFSGGKGLDDFRDEMLRDNRIRMVVDYPISEECFKGVQIKGGVCYFQWDRSHVGDCFVDTIRNDAHSKMTRPLTESGTDTFIRYNEAVSIYRKVHNKGEKSFSELVSARKPFGLSSDDEGDDKAFSGGIKVYGNKKVSYMRRTVFGGKYDALDKYKILISYAYGAGEDFPHQIINKPFIAGPDVACTETYLVVGASEERATCENIMSYIKTKFMRFLVLLLKNTQHATKSVYQLVPMQDFSKPWTDAELYAKYKLTKDEIAFIESMIKPMA